MFWKADVFDQEVRSVTTGTSKKSGKPFATILCEDEKGGQNRVSCTGDLISVATALKKGDLCEMHVVIVGTPDYAYTTLDGDYHSDALRVTGNAYDDSSAKVAK